jgi:hypothetical protein
MREEMGGTCSVRDRFISEYCFDQKTEGWKTTWGRRFTLENTIEIKQWNNGVMLETGHKLRIESGFENTELIAQLSEH